MKKALNRSRTGDLILTKDALYLLSYKSKKERAFYVRVPYYTVAGELCQPEFLKPITDICHSSFASEL